MNKSSSAVSGLCNKRFSIQGSKFPLIISKHTRFSNLSEQLLFMTCARFDVREVSLLKFKDGVGVLTAVMDTVCPPSYEGRGAF